MANIESAIIALRDIATALKSNKPVDSFITNWANAQYVSLDVANVYDTMRAVYAENVDEAIRLLTESLK